MRTFVMSGALLLSTVLIVGCSETEGPAGPADTPEVRLGISSVPGVVSVTGAIDEVLVTPPPPFARVGASDVFGLSYTFDPTTRDVDPNSTAGQYQNAITEMTLAIGAATVTGVPGIAEPNGLASGIFVNLTDDFADYVGLVGMPTALAWAQAIFRDDTRNAFTGDLLPVVLPTDLLLTFPTRLFVLRQPNVTSLFLLGTVRALTPKEAIGFLIDVTGGFVADGSLSATQGDALITRLERAASALDRGNTRTTIQQLEGFVDYLCGISTTPSFRSELCGIQSTPGAVTRSRASNLADTQFILLISTAQEAIDQL